MQKPGNDMILLMRHGQIVQSHPRRFVGQRDIPLDDSGREQARKAGPFLASFAVDHVVSSDLPRCVETATLATGGRFRIETDRDLREISLGQWEGRTSEEVRETWPSTYEARGRDLDGTRPEGGESFHDLARRVVPCFERIAARKAGGTLIVAHSGVNRVLLCHLLGMGPSRVMQLGQDYGCINILELTDWGWCVSKMNLDPGCTGTTKAT